MGENFNCFIHTRREHVEMSSQSFFQPNWNFESSFRPFPDEYAKNGWNFHPSGLYFWEKFSIRKGENFNYFIHTRRKKVEMSSESFVQPNWNLESSFRPFSNEYAKNSWNLYPLGSTFERSSVFDHKNFLWSNLEVLSKVEPS